MSSYVIIPFAKHSVAWAPGTAPFPILLARWLVAKILVKHWEPAPEQGAPRLGENSMLLSRNSSQIFPGHCVCSCLGTFFCPGIAGLYSRLTDIFLPDELVSCTFHGANPSRASSWSLATSDFGVCTVRPSEEPVETSAPIQDSVHFSSFL